MNHNLQNLINTLEKEVVSGKEHLEPHIFLEAYNNLAKVCYHHKKYNLALNYLKEAKKDVNPNKKNTTFLTYVELTAKIYLVLNNQVKADSLFSYLDLAKDCLDILKSVNHTKIATIIYETDKKEAEIKQQIQQLKNKENEISGQQQRQLVFIVFIIFLIILLGLGYFIFKKTKAQKRLIDNTLKQKELLLKEIHHRVKNNLQVVSSILKSQEYRSDNELIKEVMASSQNRIKAMAIIHQKLYQTEDFENISFKDYVHELIRNITLSNKNTHTVIDTIVNINDHFLHIDIAVPLGLILNELLTNCYKYAFIGRPEGTIEIRLEKNDTQKYSLTIKDNGVGLPHDIEEKSKKSLGLAMINGLAWQLDGEMSYSSDVNGTIFNVIFNGTPSKNARS
ncbi:MAG: sensor histidine kinase [Flavobacteriales bacterium]|nr:sensor histidine kinase [Flavobacteriales bacterium]